MHKLLSLFLSLLLPFSVCAQEQSETAIPENTEHHIENAVPAEIAIEETAVKETIENTPSAKEEDLSAEVIKQQLEEINSPTEEKQPEVEIIHRVENKALPLPDCNDKRLHEETKRFITAYFERISNGSMLYRRRRYFVLNNINKFTKENIADYKTPETSPVSDIIADRQINGGIAEMNMRLCKNQSENRFAKNIYLLIYPYELGWKVHILNLLGSHEKNSIPSTFIYEN